MPTMLRKMRILVVEDEAGIADFVRRGLESDGYAVDWAADGEEGEAKALGGDFDLVLLDVMLPGRDGLEVLASIRRALPALPVILLTARGEVEDRVRGLDSGATDYVTKPFSFDELALGCVPTSARRSRTGQPASRWGTSRSIFCGAR